MPHIPLFCLISLSVGLALVAVPTEAEENIQIRAAEITAYGIFDSRMIERRAKLRTSRSVGGDAVGSVRFVDFTDEIPGELGTNFGIQYVINSRPRGQKVDVEYVIRFPGEGLEMPGGRVYKESRDRAQARLGYRILHGYAFDEEWEIIPGDWTFEVWYNNARLVRKTLTVLPPAAEEDIGNDAGSEVGTKLAGSR